MVYGMATMPRHKKIVQGFVFDSESMARDFEQQPSQTQTTQTIEPWDSDIALLYHGKPSSYDWLHLYTHDYVGDLTLSHYIEPDFMLFQHNEYIFVDGWKIKGCPDLIVEIWSPSNSASERKWKRELFSTGKNTEHWYFTQESNEVECWFEDKQIGSQTLKDILVTKNGLEFDLRRLAI